ncbi:MAG: histidine phosphatase family protein [Pseudomonadota bacterium]
MGRVILVRHGQASFFGASYDRLSPLGREQARALGLHWAAHGVAFDRVYVGPRTRHRETCELVAAAYAERGLPWPRAIELPELDEHHGLTVIKRQLGRADLDNDALHPGEIGDGEREHAIRQFFRHYLEIMRDWARGTITVDGVEPWAEFRTRALRALDLLCTAPGAASDRGGAGAVAFTSGGLVSATVGWLLGLDDDRVIDLSVVLRNTALTEVSWSGRRRSLVSFNALPHLADPRHATAV